MSSHNEHGRTTVAIVFGTEGDPIAVLCDPDSDPPGQRWFTVVLDDTPGVGQAIRRACVHRLPPRHPSETR